MAKASQGLAPEISGESLEHSVWDSSFKLRHQRRIDLFGIHLKQNAALSQLARLGGCGSEVSAEVEF